MNITRFTDYSLRTLIFLAIHNERQATIQEIADCYSISKNHLMKVVQELNAKGYVIATRGKNGGVKLGRVTEQINIGELIRGIEQGSTLVECFGDNNQCVITPHCQLKGFLQEAMEAFFVSLEQYTLADLIRPKERKQLLNILTLQAS